MEHFLSANPNGWKRRCLCMDVFRASWRLAPQHPIPLSRRTMDRIADSGNGPSGYLGRVCVPCMRPIVCVPDSVLCRHSTNYRTCSSIVRIASVSVPGRFSYPRRFYSPESERSFFSFFCFGSILFVANPFPVEVGLKFNVN